MEKKREALSQFLDKWYAEGGGERKKILEDVVSGRAGVSLRTFDWFVTNYSARKSVAYEKDGRMVVVNSDYKDLLKCFHKAAFDSFKRRGKCKDDEEAASLRQKNFFRWAIQNGVVDFVVQNASEIEEDMKSRKRKYPAVEGEGGGEGEERQPKKKKKNRDELVTITQKIVCNPQ